MTVVKITKELIERAKQADSAEGILALAAENGIDLPLDRAQAYFDMLSQRVSELSDDELSNVAGGVCRTEGFDLNLQLAVSGRELGSVCPCCGCDCWEIDEIQLISPGTVMHHYSCAVCREKAKTQPGMPIGKYTVSDDLLKQAPWVTVTI